MIKVVKDNLRALLGNIRAMESQKVLIGIPESKSSRSDGVGNAALGYIHENGSPARNIPARPFLVPGVDQAGPEIANVLKGYARQALSDKQAVAKGLNAAGLIAQSTVKMRIRNSEGFAPLAPKTIAARKRKGSKGESPLIRTGQLLNSITYVVRGS